MRPADAKEGGLPYTEGKGIAAMRFSRSSKLVKAMASLIMNFSIEARIPCAYTGCQHRLETIWYAVMSNWSIHIRTF